MPFKLIKTVFIRVEPKFWKEKERISKFLSEEEFRKIQIRIYLKKVVIKGEETSLEKIRKNMPSL